MGVNRLFRPRIARNRQKLLGYPGNLAVSEKFGDTVAVENIKGRAVGLTAVGLESVPFGDRHIGFAEISYVRRPLSRAENRLEIILDLGDNFLFEGASASD